MARKRKRVIILRLPPAARRDPDSFLRYLSKALIGDTILMRLQGDKLRIEIYGGEALAAMTLANIKRLLEEYRVRQKRPGETRVSRAALNKAAGVAVPLDVLVEALKASGYRAWQDDNGDLVSNADPDTVLGLASAIGAALRDTQLLEATRTAKKLVVATMALAGVDQVRAIDAGMEAGVLDEDDEGKLYVRGDWREALKKVLEVLRQ